MITEIGGQELVAKAARLIKEGQLVAFPTETVYGLGADATNPKAVAKIFEAKGRPQDNPLIVHIADTSMLQAVAVDIPAEAYRLYDAFSPGPLTVVLKRSDRVPSEVTAGLSTVGVRIPRHPLALALIKTAGVGIAAPSANTSKRISPTTAAHVAEDMDGKIPMILDGGQCDVGIESTIVDLTKDVPTILRPGAITEAMLMPVLGVVKTFSGVVKVAEAPGMKYKHYAPVVPCVLAATAQAAANKAAEVKGSAVLGRDAFIKDMNCNRISLGDSLESMERLVYSAMRDAEKRYSMLIVELPENEGIGASIRNRIIKSAEGKIIGEEQ